MLSLYAKLAIIAAIALGLAASHWKAYTHGKQVVQQKYDALATQAAISAMKTQERLQEAVQTVGEKHEETKRANVASAGAASAELARLRDELARSGNAAEAPKAACRIDAGRTERELLGQCAGVVQNLAAEADRLEGKLTGLQEYVRAIQTP
jgi:Tfp pilus assembly protein PilV